jgi:hypothetical protein
MAEVTQTQALPAPFIETLGKTFGEQLGRLAPQEIDTTKFQPTLATPGGVGQAAQQAAATQAGLGALQFGTSGEVTGVGAGRGVGAYQPYLAGAGTLAGQAAAQVTPMAGYGQAAAGYGQAAAGYGTAAAGLTGAGAGTGAGTVADYMSPYTTNVIDAMKQQMGDVKSQQDIARSAQTVGAGAFGGARSGVAKSIADTEYNRMVGQMTAQQQGQNYQQAVGRRQQDLTNQLGLGQYQQGLGQYQQGLGQYAQGIGGYQQGLAQQQLGLGQYQQGMEGQRIQGMAQLGQTDIGYRQAMADTIAKQQQMKAYEPYQRTGFFGEQLTGLMGGYPGGSRMTMTPAASPMQQGISTGLGALMGYAGFKNLMG